MRSKLAIQARALTTIALSFLFTFFTSTVSSEQLDYYVVEGLTEPFQISDPDATQKGFITEVVEALAAKLNIELVTHVAPSPRIELLLKDESKTNWIAYDSPAWKSIPMGVPLSTPLLSVTHSAVHCGLRHDFANRIQGHSFAVLKHFRYPGLSRLAKEGDIELVPTKSYEQGFQLVDLKRVDGFIEMDSRLRYKLNNATPPPTCREISSIGDAEPAYDLVLMVSQSMKAKRRAQLDNALQQLSDNGLLQKLLEKYAN